MRLRRRFTATTAAKRGVVPNEYGGRENLEAIEFLRNTSRVLGEQTPGAVDGGGPPTSPGVTHRLRRRSWLLVQMEPRLDA